MAVHHLIQQHGFQQFFQPPLTILYTVFHKQVETIQGRHIPLFPNFYLLFFQFPAALVQCFEFVFIVIYNLFGQLTCLVLLYFLLEVQVVLHHITFQHMFVYITRVQILLLVFFLLLCFIAQQYLLLFPYWFQTALFYVDQAISTHILIPSQ